MSLRNSELHVLSGALTVAFVGGIALGLVYFTARAEAHKPIIDDNMEAIEASVAFTKAPQKQPQKKFRTPDPVEKPTGVSHDEKAKPVEKKNEPPKKDPKPDEKDPFKKFQHPTDDSEDPVGKPTTDPGVFNGSERGWASETKGHPFFQKFAQDIHDNFTLPTISQSNGSPVGCFHITADGKIVDTKFENGGDPDLSRAAQDAIDAVKKLRNQNPIPVPTELLGAINRWICFRFNPNAAH